LSGNTDDAIAYLQKAIAINPQKYREMAAEDPDFEGIRDDQRFIDLINF
jgi:hypothetical protein